jgi:2-iminobutanoate/2-iminopropanoate deaminase
MTRRIVTTDRIAPAVGPFAAGVWGGEFLFLSGQVALDPKTGKLIDGDVAKQTEQVFANALAVLSAAGKSLADVVKTNVYLTDMGAFAAMNAVYGHFFEAPYPARTTVAVAALPLGALVEIEMLAR